MKRILEFGENESALFESYSDAEAYRELAELFLATLHDTYGWRYDWNGCQSPASRLYWKMLSELENKNK